jgi:hypothetical protein
MKVHNVLWIVLTGILLSLGTFNVTEAQTVVNGGRRDTLLCNGGCLNLVSAAQFPGQVGSSYTISPIPHNPYPYNVGNNITMTDDTYSPVIQIGFPFKFFCAQFTSLVVGSNQILAFDPSLANQHCDWSVVDSVPNDTFPRGCIMGPYQDINPNLGGTIRTTVVGTAPNRKFVVSYLNVPMFSCTTIVASSQIVLHEDTYDIDVFITQKPLCPNWNGGTAILGLQDSSTQASVVFPGRNFPGQWVASNEGWRFSPNTAAQRHVEWFHNGSLLGQHDSVLVCPNGAITYNAIVRTTNCAGDSMIYYDTLDVVLTSSPIVAQAGADTAVCPGATITLHGSGGNQYVWKNAAGQVIGSAANLLVGPINAPLFVSLSAIDSTTGCISRPDTVSIGIIPNPYIAHAGADTLICRGVSIQLHGTGGGIYSWTNALGQTISASPNPTVGPIQNSTYYLLRVADLSSGCVSSADTVFILVRPLIFGGYINGAVNVHTGSNYYYTTSAPQSSLYYNWIAGNGTVTSGQGSPAVYVMWNNVTPISLCYVTTDSAGCRMDSTCLNNLHLGIFPASTRFEIYPNPFDNQIFVEGNWGGEALDIALYDALGRMVFFWEGRPSASLLSLDLESAHLTAGIYVLRMDLGGKQYWMKVQKRE